MSAPLLTDLTDDQCDALEVEAIHIADEALKFADSIGARNAAGLTLLGEAFAAAIVSCMGPNPSEERMIYAIGHAANSVAQGVTARVLMQKETLQ